LAEAPQIVIASNQQLGLKQCIHCCVKITSHSTDHIQFCVDSEYQSDDDVEVWYSGIVVC